MLKLRVQGPAPNRRHLIPSPSTAPKVQVQDFLLFQEEGISKEEVDFCILPLYKVNLLQTAACNSLVARGKQGSATPPLLCFWRRSPGFSIYLVTVYKGTHRSNCPGVCLCKRQASVYVNLDSAWVFLIAGSQ